MPRLLLAQIYEVPTASSNVRVRGRSGKHMLIVSSSLFDPTRTSLADTGQRWTKLPMVSTWDDICWIWSKRASSTSIVASLYRLAVVPFHLVQQLDGKVA
jgi:hypothetical protein